jgi:hypothetical protein
MSNKTNETVSIAGLWITLILSIAFFVQQLSANGVLG